MNTFSIIVPAYNYANFIGNALSSLLDQDYPHKEIIVVNDGSTDETDAIVQPYLKKYCNEIKYFKKNNGGAGSARNTGISLATNDYLIFLDADDRLLPGALAIFDNALTANPNIDAVFAGHTVVRGNNAAERHHAPVVTSDNEKNFLKILHKNFPAPTGSYALKRAITKNIKFSEKITNYEDGIFLAQLIANHAITSIDKPVVAIHRHRSSLRSRLKTEKHPADLMCDILFDPNIMPERLLKYRSNYKSTHLLRLFRRALLNKNWEDAKRYYHEAIQVNKYNILQLRYLKKYIMLRLKILLSLF